ncbi:uncharacterized protein LOC114556590 isoform X2 [Perca flavescens]|uniref:uncharacterized protein LOC114556590 isoform X2 n=1 Tax=Perca flavescens TaxID=8167 RepID=UPI00106EBAAE|nr:uncharacterized protein LOC114556590 isoform X2 [Perca flavescens]
MTTKLSMTANCIVIGMQRITPQKSQRNMDTKIMIFCLLVAAIISPVFTEEWRASVVKELDALVTSCVVVPCSFTHPKEKLPTSRLRGIWHLSTDKNKRIYYEDSMQVILRILH